MRRDRFRCQQCGATANLEVHHWTYERFGRELMSDLGTLCYDCHRQVHRESEGDESIISVALRSEGLSSEERPTTQSRRRQRRAASTPVCPSRIGLKLAAAAG